MKTITTPPAKVELRYRADRLFRSKLEAFARIKSNLHDADDCLIGCLDYCDVNESEEEEAPDDFELEQLMVGLVSKEWK
jgi:hypothetical protein